MYLTENNRPQPALDANPHCYSVTIFTNRWREVREFYVDILGAKVLSERTDRYCEMEVGGLPICIRNSECGEMVSYFHLYLSLKNREPVLLELRNDEATALFRQVLIAEPSNPQARYSGCLLEPR